MSTRESALEKKLVAYGKKLGLLCYKFTSPGHPGVPDRLFIRPEGKVLFLEIKAPGKKPEALQIREMNAFRTHTSFVGWVDNQQSGVDVLSYFMKTGQVHPSLNV